MKKVLRKIFLFLFLDFVPYMRIGRKKLYLVLLKLYSKKVGNNLNFHYGVIFQATNKTTFGNNIDIGNGSYLDMGGGRMHDWK